MQQSIRKKMSITKLTLARIKYIRKYYFQYVNSYISKRRDIMNIANMHKDTMIIEVGVEVLFKAICAAVELSPEEADKLAVEEYAVQKAEPDKYLDKLSNLVEIEHQAGKRSGITPEDRQKAVEEYRSKRNQEISNEWDEHK